MDQFKELIDKIRDYADSHLRMSTAQIIIVVLLGLSIVAASFLIYVGGKPVETVKVKSEKPRSESKEKPTILKVHVAGAVAAPGLYELKDGNRIDDAIKAAGGALQEADLDAVNLAEKVNDGQKIMVPVRAAQRPAEASQVIGEAPEQGKIGINSAGPTELQELDGIGPVLAERIVAYRKKNGPFKTKDELKNVTGIGDKKYETVKDSISLD